MVDHYTYVIAGDGCLMEGLSHEAISLAGHLRLSRLIVLFDDNQISIDGSTSLSCSDDQLARFEASGWSACRIDGHDPEAIAAAIEHARAKRPSVADRLPHHDRLRRAEPAGHEKAHGAPLGAEEIGKDARGAGLAAPAVRDSGIHHGRDGARSVRAGMPPAKLDRADPASQSAGALAVSRCAEPKLALRICGRDGPASSTGLPPKARTSPRRQASQLVIDAIAEALPNLLGGSADLTHSNLTRAKTHQPVRSDAWTAATFTMACASTPWRRR